MEQVGNSHSTIGYHKWNETTTLNLKSWYPKLNYKYKLGKMLVRSEYWNFWAGGGGEGELQFILKFGARGGYNPLI